jgi:hypothetical protein
MGSESQVNETGVDDGGEREIVAASTGALSGDSAQA